jgi:predicted DNA-binding transcriptional regulator AlpA
MAPTEDSFIKRTIRRHQLREIVPLADSTIYEMEQRGEFPRRFALSPRCVVWDLAESPRRQKVRPRLYDGPIHNPRPEDSDRNPSAVTHNHSDAGSGRSSRTAGVNVGGLDRRVELHRIAALLARPIARALAAAERHVIVDAGRR